MKDDERRVRGMDVDEPPLCLSLDCRNARCAGIEQEFERRERAVEARPLYLVAEALVVELVDGVELDRHRDRLDGRARAR